MHNLRQLVGRLLSPRVNTDITTAVEGRERSEEIVGVCVFVGMLCQDSLSQEKYHEQGILQHVNFQWCVVWGDVCVGVGVWSTVRSMFTPTSITNRTFSL